MSCGDAEGEESFQPRVLIWAHLSQLLAPAEVGEVKRILGSPVIDRNEDLHAEVTALWEILTDFRMQNDAIRSQAKPRLRATAAQQLLEQQIQQFVRSIRCSGEDVAVEAILSSEREREVLRAVAGTTGSSSPVSNQRPSSVGDVRPASSFGARRPSTSLSAASSASAPEVLEPLRGHLNVYDIDRVTGAIKAALEEETALLLDDISYLQFCLEETAAERDDVLLESRRVEPTVAELRGLEAKLQKEVLKRDAAQETLRILSRASAPTLMASGGAGGGKVGPAKSPPSGSSVSISSLPLRPLPPQDGAPPPGGLSKLRGTVMSPTPLPFPNPDLSASLTSSASLGLLMAGRPKSRAQRLRDEIGQARDPTTL